MVYYNFVTYMNRRCIMDTLNKLASKVSDKLPYVELYMLMSVDGKISSGKLDCLDFDRDIPELDYSKDGLYQYYDIEKTLPNWSIISGKTLSKVGWNDTVINSEKLDHCGLIVYDSGYITPDGVNNLLNRFEYVVYCYNRGLDNKHETFKMLYHVYPDKARVMVGSIEDSLMCVKENYGCEDIALQGGATFNASFFRKKLVDKVHVIVAPFIVGGAKTPTLVDGSANICRAEFLQYCNELKLISANVLKHDYIELIYEVRK